jgi:hypothetical protein
MSASRRSGMNDQVRGVKISVIGAEKAKDDTDGAGR